MTMKNWSHRFGDTIECKGGPLDGHIVKYGCDGDGVTWLPDGRMHYKTFSRNDVCLDVYVPHISEGSSVGTMRHQSLDQMVYSIGDVRENAERRIDTDTQPAKTMPIRHMLTREDIETARELLRQIDRLDRMLEDMGAEDAEATILVRGNYTSSAPLADDIARGVLTSTRRYIVGQARALGVDVE